MRETLFNLVPRDPDYPERVRRLQFLRTALDDTMYNVLPREFHEERESNGAYVPLADRRPATRCKLPRIIVDDTVSLLFSEGRFPSIESAAEADGPVLAELVTEMQIASRMEEAAIAGSVGSVALLLRVLRERPFLEIRDTRYLTPIYDPEEPDTLLRVVERYKVRGSDLRLMGYDIADRFLSSQYWWQRQWDDQGDVIFVPLLVSEAAKGTAPAVDPVRSRTHGLGFVPVVWIRNLPGGDAIDGACTFDAAIEGTIAIDYQMSQAGRGLKYSADPTLIIREPAMSDGEMVRSPDSALIVSEKGDAKLLEIGGTAAEAVIAYVDRVRMQALEAARCHRGDGEARAKAQSGWQLELVDQSIISVADRLRASYGAHGLLPFIDMVARASARTRLRFRDGRPIKLSATAKRTLVWGAWYPLTINDKQAEANTLGTLFKTGLMSRETAVSRVVETYDVADEKKELAAIAADEAAADARIAQQKAVQVKATETLEG